MTLRIAVLVSIFIVIIVAACGGGDQELTLEEYLTEMVVIFDKVDADVFAQIDRGLAQLPESPEESQAFLADESNLPILQNLTSDTPRIMGAAVARMKDLVAPPEADQAHNNLVAAAEDLRAAFEERQDARQGAETIAELLALDFDSAGESAAFDQACRSLQNVFIAHGIAISVNCSNALPRRKLVEQR